MVFGKVISGLEVVREIEVVPTTADKPNEDVVIVDCGELVGEEEGADAVPPPPAKGVEINPTTEE